MMCHCTKMKANQFVNPGASALHLLRTIALLGGAAVLISGCSRMASGPTFPSEPIVREAVATPEPTVAASPIARLEQQASDLSLSGYVDSTALQSMSAKDQSEATSAQFYALQFGRPGAPRTWSGDSGATGEVTVGPYIRVNNQDCREYTHEVTVSGTDYTHSGTSCREMNGDWRPAATG